MYNATRLETKKEKMNNFVYLFFLSKWEHSRGLYTGFSFPDSSKELDVFS
jgi:hypothetical protein